MSEPSPLHQTKIQSAELSSKPRTKLQALILAPETEPSPQVSNQVPSQNRAPGPKPRTRSQTELRAQKRDPTPQTDPLSALID